MRPEDIEIQVWDKVEVLKRWKELIPSWIMYWWDEPTSSALRKCWAKKSNRDGLVHYLHVVISHCQLPTMVAWDTKNEKVAGFVLSRLLYSKKVLKEHPELAPVILTGFKGYGFDEETENKMAYIWKFVGEYASRADAFSYYNVDKLWMCSYGNTLPEYRTLGILHRLDRQCAIECFKRKIPVIRGHVVGKFATKAVTGFNPDKLLEVNIKEHFALYDDIPEEIRKVHDTITVVAGRVYDIRKGIKPKL